MSRCHFVTVQPDSLHLSFYRALVCVVLLALPLSASASREPAAGFDNGGLGARELARTEDLAEKSGPAGDFFKLKQAEALLVAGKTEGAAKLAQKADSAALVLWKNLVLAEAHIASGRFEEALGLLKNDPPRPRPELSFGETAYRKLYERRQKAKAAARKALNQDASREKAELHVLDDEASGEAAPALDAEQKMALLRRLHFSYQYKKVTGLVTKDEILSSKAPRDDKCQALYKLGDSLRRNAGQLENGMGAFAALAREDCGDDLTARALYWLGHGHVSLKNETGAVAALANLNKRYPRHRLADDALYLLERLYRKLGNAAKAEQYGQKLLQWPRGDMRNQEIFEEGYPLYKKGDYAKAAAVFARAAEGEPSLDESYPQILYWQARSLEKAGGQSGRKKALPIYRKLVSDFPFSFHAVLAASRLNTAVKVPELPVLSGNPPDEGNEYFSLIDTFNRSGFHDEASFVMDLAIHAHPEWEKSHEEFIARKFMECRNYRKALEMAAVHFDSGVYGPTMPQADPMFAALYPKAYAQQTSRGYATTRLPRGAIEGIMREESLFQRNVKSWVGATGLMQLMPTTAQMLRRKLPNAGDLSDLTDPLSNILLGSTYLSDMRDFFDGRLPLAIMAYNAGPGNVKKWLRNIGASELDEFIEDIPFSETKGYVKRVMRSMQVYGALYKEPYFRKPFFKWDVRS